MDLLKTKTFFFLYSSQAEENLENSISLFFEKTGARDLLKSRTALDRRKSFEGWVASGGKWMEVYYLRKKNMLQK